MPQYNADPTKDVAGFPMFAKGDYEFKIGEPKPFHNTGDKGENYGVAYLLTCVDGTDKSMVGKKFYKKCFQHSQGGKDFSKTFIMAALGFDTNSEAEFNEAAKDADWSFNTDNGEVGEGWRAIGGKGVVASLSVGKRKDDNTKDQQNEDGWRPLVPVSA